MVSKIDIDGTTFRDRVGRHVILSGCLVPHVGGDGAPGWTFNVAGLDFTKFGPSGAAHLMQYRYDPVVGGRQDSYPVMSWSGNYARPANGIMW